MPKFIPNTFASEINAFLNNANACLKVLLQLKTVQYQPVANTFIHQPPELLSKESLNKKMLL
jgi:hypothetical protein